jgi:3-methylfumaryl-CoA hydratase
VSEPWRDWLGRTQIAAETLGLGPARAMTALLDRDPAEIRAGDPLPPCWHWLYLHQAVRRSAIGGDGHPRRGDWLPPIPLVRRMWAGSRLRFPARLRLGEPAERRSEVAKIESKEGRAGPLVFVTVRHSLTGPEGLSAIEEQDLVFRDPAPAPAPAPAAAGSEGLPAETDWEERFTPDPATLFRFSAITMNGHRIHYDAPYATEIEGYRALVVHAPFAALLLLDAATRRHRAEAATFEFRATRPLFNPEPITLAGRLSGDHPEAMAVWAAGPDRRIAVSGTIGWRP